MRFELDDTKTKISYNYRQFPYFNFKWKNAKNLCVLQWEIRVRKLYLNLKLKNAKKHAFCNGGHEYGNYIHFSFKW